MIKQSEYKYFKQEKRFYFILFYFFNYFDCYYGRAHNVFGTLWWMSFLAKFVAGGLEFGKK